MNGTPSLESLILVSLKNNNIWGLRKLLLLLAILKGVVTHAIKEVKVFKKRLSLFDNFL